MTRTKMQGMGAMAPMVGRPMTSMVMVTPDMAAQWLEDHNTSNRNLRQQWVNHLANMIREGYWVDNGDTIRFAADGTLIDGQHRLWAVVESKCTVAMRVVRGLDPKVVRTIDRGKTRTVGDWMRMLGHNNATTLASTLRWMLAYEWMMKGHMFTRNGLAGKLEPATAEHLLVKYPSIVDSVAAARPVTSKLRAPGAAVAFAHYLVWNAQPMARNRLKDFMRATTDGVGLAKGDSALLLRERLFREQSANTRQTGKWHVAAWLAAWNVYGEKRKLLRVDQNNIVWPGRITPEV